MKGLITYYLNSINCFVKSNQIEINFLSTCFFLSAQLKRPRSSLRLSKSQSRPDMTTVGSSSLTSNNKQDYNSLNKSIENLITVRKIILKKVQRSFKTNQWFSMFLKEGQTLLEEIRITADKQSNVNDYHLFNHVTEKF